ncbi:MAG: four helix bundle protein [Clostridia bacterium]|nr:four helix bundle protein [Clostridia bacterium]
MSWIHYQKLVVWQKAMDMVQEVYRLVKQLPAEEKFALSDQIRRAAVSVPSNIAEGQGRQSEKEFKQFLSIAKGSVFEVETQLIICIRADYLTEEQAEAALNLCDEIGKMLSALINK